MPVYQPQDCGSLMSPLYQSSNQQAVSLKQQREVCDELHGLAVTDATLDNWRAASQILQHAGYLYALAIIDFNIVRICYHSMVTHYATAEYDAVTEKMSWAQFYAYKFMSTFEYIDDDVHSRQNSSWAELYSRIFSWQEGLYSWVSDCQFIQADALFRQGCFLNAAEQYAASMQRYADYQTLSIEDKQNYNATLYKLSKSYLQHARDLIEATQSDAAMVFLYKAKDKLEQMGKQDEKALELHDKILYKIGYCYICEVRILLKAGDYTSAQNICKKALDVLNPIKNKVAEDHKRINEVNSYIAMSIHQEALAVQSLSLAEQAYDLILKLSPETPNLPAMQDEALRTLCQLYYFTAKQFKHDCQNEAAIVQLNIARSIFDKIQDHSDNDKQWDYKIRTVLVEQHLQCAQLALMQNQSGKAFDHFSDVVGYAGSIGWRMHDVAFSKLIATVGLNKIQLKASLASARNASKNASYREGIEYYELALEHASQLLTLLNDSNHLDMPERGEHLQQVSCLRAECEVEIIKLRSKVYVANRLWSVDSFSASRTFAALDLETKRDVIVTPR